MGKHSSNGLSYFNIDCVQEDNLNYIEAKHGISGYGVLVKLWRKIYMIEGYYCQWSEKNVFLFAKEVGVPVVEINDIVESCFAEDIFSRDMYQRYKILTSSGVQKRWLKIVTEAKRKNCKILDDFLLLNKNPEQVAKTPEELTKTPEELPQRKVKERKEKKTKVENDSAPAQPSPPARVDKVKLEKLPEEHWQELVNAFFEFYEQNFKGQKPSFDGRITRDFKTIVQRLRRRAAERKKEWSQENARASLIYFLSNAIKDEWLKNHFLVSNLLEQFDAVFVRAISEKPKQARGPRPAGTIVKTFDDELDFYHDMHSEGRLRRELYTDLYDKLTARSYIKVGSMDLMPGSSIEEKKAAAVAHYFTNRSNKKVVA